MKTKIYNYLLEEIMKEEEEKSANHVFDTEVITFDIAQRDKYELDLQGKFEVVLREGKYYVERIKPQYPKTYEECCNELKVTHVEWWGYLGEILVPFQKLLICRDVYWKIAGDEMGLNKPWEPDWKDDEQFKYIIICRRGCIIKDTYTAKDVILAFPTAEMRDAFYKNFKDLIEQCKEFL